MNKESKHCKKAAQLTSALKVKPLWSGKGTDTKLPFLCKPGVYALYGHLHNMTNFFNSNVAKDVCENGMVRFYPRKSSPAGQLLAAAEIPYQKLPLLNNYRPVAITGSGKGSWVAHGPMDETTWLKIDREGEWDEVVATIDEEIGGYWNLLMVKVIVHNDRGRSRDVLTYESYYLHLTAKEAEEAEALNKEHEGETSKASTESLDDSQKKITNYFRSKKK